MRLRWESRSSFVARPSLFGVRYSLSPFTRPLLRLLIQRDGAGPVSKNLSDLLNVRLRRLGWLGRTRLCFSTRL